MQEIQADSGSDSASGRSNETKEIKVAQADVLDIEADVIKGDDFGDEKLGSKFRSDQTEVTAVEAFLRNVDGDQSPCGLPHWYLADFQADECSQFPK